MNAISGNVIGPRRILQFLACWAICCCSAVSQAEQVNGKLLEWGPAGIRFEEEGGKGVREVAINRDTHVRVYAKGSREFLVPGATVAVHGVFTADGVIKSGRGNMSFDGEVMVYIHGQPPASKNPPTNVVRLEEQKQVGLVATPLSADPLVVQGLYEYSDPAIAVPRPQGGLLAVSMKGRRFTVQPSKEDFVVLHLGNRIDLAGAGSHVAVFVPDNGAPLANLVIVERSEPYTLEQLGLKKPISAKEKRKVERKRK